MTLPKTTRARLALYRQRAAANKYGRNDWRQNMAYDTWAKPYHNWTTDRRKIYADNRDTLGDYLGNWGEFLSGRCWDANGFYIDDFYSETMRGGVEKIRTARGTLYVPVTYCTGWDGVTYHMGEAFNVPKGCNEDSHTEAQQEAAAAAYHYADKEAEAAREDNAKERAADQIHDARAEIHEINKHTRTLLAEIRAAGTFSPVICEALRDKVRDLLADRRRCFETIAERTENYWSAISY